MAFNTYLPDEEELEVVNTFSEWITNMSFMEVVAYLDEALHLLERGVPFSDNHEIAMCILIQEADKRGIITIH